MKNIMLNMIPNLKEQVGDYGLEIESEGHRLPQVLPPDVWRIELDGSLKSGMEGREYVTPKPVSLEGVGESLQVLYKAYTANKSDIHDTITSGVHVHVNVQQFSPKELFTFLTTYLILEELITTFCGEHREGNHFCLRAKDAEWVIHDLFVAAKKKSFKGWNKDHRYGAMNLCALFKYGSIEFRAMRGTADLDAIYKWVCILDSIKTNSLKFRNPAEAVISISDGGEANFLEFILGEDARLFTKKKGWQRMILEGARRVQAVAFSVDWDEFRDKRNNPFAKEMM